MKVLLDLRRELIDEIKKEAKTEEEAKRLMDILEISVARIASRIESNEIILDRKIIPEIQESLRIGGKIDQGQAKQIMDKALEMIRKQNGPVKLFSEGTIEIEGDTLTYLPEEKEHQP